MPARPLRRARPALERLDAIAPPSASAAGVASRFVDLTSGPIAADAKTYLAAATPSQGRQRGVVNGLVADPVTRTVAGVMTIQYRVRALPTIVSPFYSPTLSFAMRVGFVTSLDDPSPGDVSVSYTSKLVPFGGDVRTKVALGVTAFLRHDSAAISAALG